MQKILDCTLRDGGYYNNWDFCPNVVKEYLRSIADSKIEYVELGLRNFPKDGFLGAFAYTTENFIYTLELPDGPKYGVMVDAKTILESGFSVNEAINKLFVAASESKIDLVRIAAHFHEVENSGQIVKKLKELGYIVGFNLMQAGGKPDEVIASKAKTIQEWNELDVLYFADSLGNMDSQEVTRIASVIKGNWKGEIGIHTHNNMGKGLDNSLIARQEGVLWLDATITGMGRGAGNTQTESLLAVLDKEGSHYNPKPIYDLVIRHFEPMQRQYLWGSSLLYFLGAQNDIHPTYIQNLLSNTHYGTDEIVGAIDYLSRLEGTTSYNGEVLNTAISFKGPAKEISGGEQISNLFSNKEVLIVTSGPSLKKYQVAIENYIKERRPIVIAINAISLLSSELVDYYVVSHNTKFLSEHETYKNLQKPLILPAHRFTDSELKDIKGKYLDYGLQLTEEVFNANIKSCVVPFDLTFAYGMAIALTGSASKVSMVGIDGYEKGDLRQIEMVDLFSLVKQAYPNIPMTALTPSSYSILQSSVYAPAK